MKEGMFRTWPTVVLQKALVAMKESDDYANPTACVIVSREFPVAIASNRTGLGHGRLSRSHSSWCLRKHLRNLIDYPQSGTGYWVCPGCASPKNHAEARAAAFVKERVHGGRVVDGTAYLLGHYHACKPCMKALKSVGVTKIIFKEGAEICLK